MLPFLTNCDSPIKNIIDTREIKFADEVESLDALIKDDNFDQATDIADRMVSDGKVKDAAEIYFRMIKAKNFANTQKLESKIYQIFNFDDKVFKKMFKDLRAFRAYIAGYFMCMETEKNLQKMGINLTPNTKYKPMTSAEFKLRVTMAHIRDYFPSHADTVKKWLQETENGFPCSKHNKQFIFQSTIPGAAQDLESHKFDTIEFGVASYQKPFNHVHKDKRKEDFTVVDTFTCDFKEKKDLKCIFGGLFDGHGGTSCASYLSKNLGPILKKNLEGKSLESDTEIFNAINATCLALDEDWHNDETLDSSGSTGSFIVIIENTLWSSNIGDSRIVLNENGSAIQLSEDAQVSNPKFASDAEDRGALLLTHHDEKEPRLYARLDMTKVFGDFFSLEDITKDNTRVKPPGLSPVGQVLKRSFDPKKGNTHVIIGSDGFWDKRDTSEVVEFVQECAGSVKTIAKVLVEASFKRLASNDDTTVIVVKLS